MSTLGIENEIEMGTVRQLICMHRALLAGIEELRVTRLGSHRKYYARAGELRIAEVADSYKTLD